MLNALVPFTVTAEMRAAAARHMRLPSGFDVDQTADIDDALTAAISHLEAALGLCLVPRAFIWEGCLDADKRADVPIGPLRSVADALSVGPPTQSVDVQEFRVETLTLRGGLSAVRHIPGTLRLTIFAGFGEDWDSTPADLRRAVMMLTAHYFDQRHAVAEGVRDVPHGVAALIQPWKPLRLSLRGQA